MKVEALYTLKDPKGGYIPKGVYSDKSQKGVPEVVVNELLRGANTVRLLSGKLPKKNTQVNGGMAKDEAVTMVDHTATTTTSEPEPTEPLNEPVEDTETTPKKKPARRKKQ